MKNIIRSVLVIGLLLPSFSFAASSVVYHEINLADVQNTWLSINLKAGDELVLRINGWKASPVPVISKSLINGSVEIEGDSEDLNNGKRKYHLKLDSNYYLPNLSKADACPKKTLGVRAGDNPDVTCVQIPYFVIKDGGRYTAVSILDTQTDVLVFNKSLVNKSSSWSLGFSGGFFGSGLTNKKYFADETMLENENGVNQTIQIVARNKETEDDFSLGLGAFVHTCYEDQGNGFWSKVAPDCLTLGLGLSDQSQDLNFLPGISYRLGDEFYLTFGAQMAKVNALPRGLKEGDTIESANDLTTLDSKYEVSFAVTVSYSFLGGNSRQTFSSPFSSSAN